MTNYIRKDESLEKSELGSIDDLVGEFSSQNLQLAAALDSDTLREEKFQTFEHLKDCGECREVFYHLNLQKALSSELNQEKELPKAAESRLWEVLKKEQKKS